ncbi:biotin/lipoyl-containing protein [Saccharicrinis aurantiacus]|uniref:biotin/lipoyl-containing protein n=1 Tax=Saccharicrinis aurantiacus TaxID=1849719 RepID=UPI00094FDF29|nr:biotin/lipoyl-containing protein [Saccharicrinis aurantiacus]
MSKDKDLVGFRVQSLEYQTKLTKKFANRQAWKEPNPLEIRSYIPGTIIDIQVEVGQVLKEGDNVLVLQAMKMLNQITMPFDAKVKEIHIKEGDRVPKNELMILLEE